MILGITWWGILLYTKNEHYYEEVLNRLTENEQERAVIIKEKKRQAIMVIGEGLVLGISLLAGIWIINRSAQKQIQTATQQNNFLLSVSHELKSPIASMKLALETLLKHPLSKEDREVLTYNAIMDADRLEKLVQNILLTTKIDNISMELYIEEIHLNRMIKKIYNKYRDNTNEVKLILDLKTNDGLVIKGDRLAIELALSNLIDNAIKYSVKNGNVQIMSSQHENKIVMKVVDEGIGIKADETINIFKRFYRTDHPEVRSRIGTGLGLYISSQVVDAHHGHIQAFSNSPAKGSTFVIELPYHD